MRSPKAGLAGVRSKSPMLASGSSDSSWVRGRLARSGAAESSTLMLPSGLQPSASARVVAIAENRPATALL
jgi:hypothetical protein